MLRWDISPDFKARRPGEIRRTVRTATVRANASADRLGRATAILSLPATLCAILLFSVGGAHGPQIVASVKDRAVRTVALMRTQDPFLRRRQIDYTPTGSICGEGCARGKATPAKSVPMVKQPIR